MSKTTARLNKASIFHFIISYKTENDGLSPTYREICEECGISSTSVVRYHLLKLEQEGKIAFGKKKRGIKIIGGEWRYR